MCSLFSRGLNDDSLHPYQIINALESEAQAEQPSEIVLSTVSVAAGISRDKSALDLIPLLTSKASNSLEFETLLRRNPFVHRDDNHIFYSEKQKAAQAAKYYLKERMDCNRAMEWSFSHTESILHIVVCFLAWLFRWDKTAKLLQ